MFDSTNRIFADNFLSVIPHNYTFSLMWLLCLMVFLALVHTLIRRFVYKDIPMGFVMLVTLGIMFSLTFLKIKVFMIITVMAMVLQQLVTIVLSAFGGSLTSMSPKSLVILLVIAGAVAQGITWIKLRRGKPQQSQQPQQQEEQEWQEEAGAQSQPAAELDENVWGSPNDGNQGGN